MDRCTQNFMSLWRSYKPTCKVRGYAVAGGSDIALSCDLVVMAEDAKIGYPPAGLGLPDDDDVGLSRGAERAKRMLFTGDLIGETAERIGLITRRADGPARAEVARLCARMTNCRRTSSGCRKRDHAAFDAWACAPPRLATVFDGDPPSPEGQWFKGRAEEVGFQQAVRERDSGAPIPGSKPPRNN